MKPMFKRLMAWCLCLVLCAALLPLPSLAVDAAADLPQLHYGEYDTLSMVYDQGDCFSMQGMTLDSSYTYCAKVNTDTDASACIIRTSKSTGAKTVMINSATGGYYFSNLGHANALDVTWVNGANQLLVTAGSTLVRLKVSGSTLTTAGTYTATYNGSSMSMTAVQIMHASEEQLKVLVKTGRTLYTGTLDPTASSGVIELTKLCTINISAARLKGEVYDFSSYLQQGMDYHDGKLFLPLSGNSQADTSVVLVYDLEGATGEIKNDPTLSFRIISASYSALFEIEDVAVCQETGKLYFNTNRRKSSSDTNYDSCSYFLNYVYNPALSTLTPADFRWETVNNELVSKTDDGATFNTATQFHGSISGDVMTHGLFSLSRSVMLKHDAPWVVEWKSSGTFEGGALLLSTAITRVVPNAPYLYRAEGSKLIALGYYSGSQYNNYGIQLSSYGIDGTAEHTYRMTNKISADGSNMVYLSVDGKELGAMNNYFVGSTSQGTTSNWISGKDFTFSYIGAYMHSLTDCKLDYLQVWAEGEPSDVKHYRWETTGDNLTAAAGSNTTTIYNGSVSGSTYTSAAFRLAEPVKLLHDQPWSLEWESQGTITGGTFLLSAAEGGANKNAPYLFRYGNSSLIALGYHDGAHHNNYGIDLSDHGIDSTEKHVYRLTNRIAADGSNMVYLYVDDVLLGAMNNAYSGVKDLGTTSDWLSGKDLTFDYVGNLAYALNGTYDRLEVWEDGKSCPIEFRDYNGSLLHTDYCKYGEIPTPPADPVRAADYKYTYTFAGWEPTLAEANGERYYLATYTTEQTTYTVTFKNDDGTVLKTQSLTYGEMPTPPADPAKEDVGNTAYTFTGWYPALSNVTADAVYTAQYTEGPKRCTVTFVNDDGTVLSTQVLEYGETPTAPAAPTKESTVSHSYTFVGWDAVLTAATRDTTYTARYVASLRKYTVTFENFDGTVLSQQVIPYGYAPTAPSDIPSRKPDSLSHYSFIGWRPALGNISGDTTYTAAYASTAHSFQTTTVEATCVATGKTTYTCASCAYSYNVTVPAKGHSYSDGICTACGAADPNYTPSVTVPTLTLKSPTLEFKDMICINAFYTAENIQDVVEMGMITYDEKVTSWSVDTADHVIPGATYVESSGRYYSSSQGIHAKYLGDTVYLAIYAKLSDGSYAYSKLAPYSAITYANSQLKNSTDAKLKQLVVAMLNYGAEAQLYFGHNTGALANASLTADQKALPETYRADMVQAVPAASAAKQGIFANNQGFASRKPAISFEGAFCINYFFTPKYEPSSGITLYYWNAEDYNAAEVLTTANATGKIKLDGSGTGEYRGDITGISAKNLSEAVYVAAAYKNDGTVWTSGVLGYSIGSYCSSQASKGTSISALAMATAVYGYHAKQYFG